MASYHSWLQQVVTPYYDPGRVFRDVDITLMTFTTLRPKTDNFHRLGPVQLLICIFGPIQCGLYNTAIEIWLPRTYPREAPIVFITPATGAPIRATGIVDPTGRIMHPIITAGAWRGEMPLSEVIRGITSALAMDPPFYPGTGRPVYPNMGPTMGMPHSYGLPSPQQQQQQQHLYSQSPASSAASFQSPQSALSLSPSLTAAAATQSANKLPSQIASLPELRTIIKDRMNAQFRKLQNDIAIESDRLLAESTELEHGQQTIKDGLKKLQAKVQKLEQEIEDARKRKEVIEGLAHEGSEIDYENLVRPQGPIAKQIINLHVEHLALQDLIYTISKAFFEGRPAIPLPIYLKHLRELAREHFMTKALLSKIRKEFPIIQ